MAKEVIEGNWFDQDLRDKVNKAAEDQGTIKPFDRKRDQ